MIESLVYTKLHGLSLTTQLYPSEPTLDISLPYIVYYVSGLEHVYTLAGPTDLSKYEVTVECWTLTQSQGASFAVSIITALDGWRDTNNGIEMGMLIDHQTQPQEQYYLNSLTFAVWANI